MNQPQTLLNPIHTQLIQPLVPAYGGSVVRFDWELYYVHRFVVVSFFVFVVQRVHALVLRWSFRLRCTTPCRWWTPCTSRPDRDNNHAASCSNYHQYLTYYLFAVPQYVQSALHLSMQRCIWNIDKLIYIYIIIIIMIIWLYWALRLAAHQWAESRLVFSCMPYA